MRLRHGHPRAARRKGRRWRAASTLRRRGHGTRPFPPIPAFRRAFRARRDAEYATHWSMGTFSRDLGVFRTRITSFDELRRQPRRFFRRGLSGASEATTLSLPRGPSPQGTCEFVLRPTIPAEAQQALRQQLQTPAAQYTQMKHRPYRSTPQHSTIPPQPTSLPQSAEGAVAVVLGCSLSYPGTKDSSSASSRSLTIPS